MEISLHELKSFKHYFFDWLDGQGANNGDMAESMLEESGRSPKNFEKHKCEFEKNYMLTVQRAAAPFLEGFLELQTSNWEDNDTTIQYIEDMISFIKEKDFMNDYMSGIQYMFRLLKLHRRIITRKEDSTRLAEDGITISQLLQDYENLEPKSKAIVSLTRWQMNESIRSRKEEAVACLEEMIRYDPTNFVWHYVICMRIRFLRRTNVSTKEKKYNSSSYPWPREIKSALAALACSEPGTAYHLMCVATLSQVMAEIVRAKHESRDFSPVTIGSTEYQTLDDIVAQLDESAREALMEKTCAYPEFIRYGEILGLILPKQYRNYMVATACMRIAYVLSPFNSKVNHKMGSLILAWKKDSRRASKFFRTAVKSEHHNAPAWLDLLPAMITYPEENRTKFEKYFGLLNEIKPTLESGLLEIFEFYEGLVSYLNGNNVEAVKLWLKSISNGWNGFETLSSLSRRYGWPKDHIKISAILESLEDVQDKVIEEKLEGIELLKDVLITAKLSETKVQEFTHRREPQIERRGSTFEHQVQQNPQATYRPRNSNSCSEADSDNSWRRSSGSTAAPARHLSESNTPTTTSTQKYVPVHIRNRNSKTSQEPRLQWD